MMIGQKLAVLMGSLSLMIANAIPVYAYVSVPTSSYGDWEQQGDGTWKYGSKKWEDGIERTEYVTGIQIIENTVYEFTDDGTFINKGQKYYRDKFNELNTEMNKMTEIITMPKIQVDDSFGFWAAYNNRLCGSSAGIQFFTGEYLECTNLDELKFATDKYMNYVSEATGYVNKVWNKYAPKDKNNVAKQLKDASVAEVLSSIKKEVNESCLITKEGSRPAYVYTGSSSINSRDLSVAISEALCRVSIPAVTCSSIETGELYVCVYDASRHEWIWCDFAQKGDNYKMSYIPGDLVYYY